MASGKSRNTARSNISKMRESTQKVSKLNTRIHSKNSAASARNGKSRKSS